MGTVCSKNRVDTTKTAGTSKATADEAERTVAVEEGLKAAKEIEALTGAPAAVTRDGEVIVAIDEEDRKQLNEERTNSVDEAAAAVVQQSPEPAAVIRKEEVVTVKSDNGDTRVHVAVVEAVIRSDLPDLPDHVENVSAEDLELLRQARKQVMAVGGPVVTDITKSDQQTSQINKPSASAYGYLLFSPDKGGSLTLLWSKQQLSAEEEENAGKVLLSFVPALHKNVPRMKYEKKGGKTELLTDIEAKWSVWKVNEKQRYYAAWATVLKAANEYEAKVTVREWTEEMPPQVFISLLHVGLVGNKVASLPRGHPVDLGVFSHIAVVPADKNKEFKDGFNLSEKKFQDLAVAAGGADQRFAPRGIATALGQDDVVAWMKEDGIDISKNERGLTLDGRMVDRANA
ncbi:immune mapped protein 1 [Toxoplasma gondii VAND]|uniref:Immune mapped protein 1 n=1 Tax=Toxoplasma gondii VAND TaxID=933077 RepID=A0A086PSA8_TOXGO|nr:immune mapped protein 1 [Toxoplasma gondii VAND]